MAEVMIPPWVRPESPETIRMIDDATVAFQPAFGRGMTQRGIWADPRWGLRRRYRGLRSDEKAAILSALNETRGQLNAMRVTPHTPIRGSFATSELIVNNTWASGATGGWSYGMVSDRVFRYTFALNASGGIALSTAASTVTQNVPYAVRFMLRDGSALWSDSDVRLGSTAGAADYGVQVFANRAGLKVAAFVPGGTTVYPGCADLSTTRVAGDYLQLQYSSLARCALIDNGPNLLLNSDALGSTWATNKASISNNTTAAPDGTSTADTLSEDNTVGDHYVAQSATITASALDYCFTVAVKANGRNFARLQLTTAASFSYQVFNLNTGTLGSTTSAGGSMSNLRAFITSLGNSWYQCSIVVRKSDANTTLAAYVMAASADSAATYTGSNSAALYAWRGTLAQSSMPVRLTQTTSSAVASGTTQTGGGIYTKGWPVSTSGLLLAADWFELNGELKQLTAPVNSDAAGLAYMQFRPGLAGSPADSDPIIVQEPFGRFIYPGTREFENLFGIYGDCEMNLEEIYS